MVFAKRFATVACHSALGLAEQLAQALAHCIMDPGLYFNQLALPLDSTALVAHLCSGN